MNAFKSFKFDRDGVECEVEVEYYDEENGFNFDVVSGEIVNEIEMDEIVNYGRFL